MEIKIQFENDDIERLCIAEAKRITAIRGEYEADSSKSNYGTARVTVEVTEAKEPEPAEPETIPAPLGGLVGSSVATAPAPATEDPF